MGQSGLLFNYINSVELGFCQNGLIVMEFKQSTNIIDRPQRCTEVVRRYTCALKVLKAHQIQLCNLVLVYQALEGARVVLCQSKTKQVITTIESFEGTH